MWASRELKKVGEKYAWVVGIRRGENARRPEDDERVGLMGPRRGQSWCTHENSLQELTVPPSPVNWTARCYIPETTP